MPIPHLVLRLIAYSGILTSRQVLSLRCFNVYFSPEPAMVSHMAHERQHDLCVNTLNFDWNHLIKYLIIKVNTRTTVDTLNLFDTPTMIPRRLSMVTISLFKNVRRIFLSCRQFEDNHTNYLLTEDILGSHEMDTPILKLCTEYAIIWCKFPSRIRIGPNSGRHRFIFDIHPTFMENNIMCTTLIAEYTWKLVTPLRRVIYDTEKSFLIMLLDELFDGYVAGGVNYRNYVTNHKSELQQSNYSGDMMEKQYK